MVGAWAVISCSFVLSSGRHDNQGRPSDAIQTPINVHSYQYRVSCLDLCCHVTLGVLLCVCDQENEWYARNEVKNDGVGSVMVA